MNITNNVIKEQEKQGIEIEGKEIDQSTFTNHTLMLNEFLAYVTGGQVTQTPQFISKQSEIKQFADYVKAQGRAGVKFYYVYQSIAGDTLKYTQDASSVVTPQEIKHNGKKVVSEFADFEGETYHYLIATNQRLKHNTKILLSDLGFVGDDFVTLASAQGGELGIRTSGKLGTIATDAREFQKLSPEEKELVRGAFAEAFVKTMKERGENAKIAEDEGCSFDVKQGLAALPAFAIGTAGLTAGAAAYKEAIEQLDSPKIWKNIFKKGNESFKKAGTAFSKKGLAGVGMGALIGGVIGASYGFATSDDDDKIIPTVKGGAVGVGAGTVGSLAPVIVNGLVGALRYGAGSAAIIKAAASRRGAESILTAAGIGLTVPLATWSLFQDGPKCVFRNLGIAYLVGATTGFVGRKASFTSGELKRLSQSAKTAGESAKEFAKRVIKKLNRDFIPQTPEFTDLVRENIEAAFNYNSDFIYNKLEVYIREIVNKAPGEALDVADWSVANYMEVLSRLVDEKIIKINFPETILDDAAASAHKFIDLFPGVDPRWGELISKLNIVARKEYKTTAREMSDEISSMFFSSKATLDDALPQLVNILTLVKKFSGSARNPEGVSRVLSSAMAEFFESSLKGPKFQKLIGKMKGAAEQLANKDLFESIANLQQTVTRAGGEVKRGNWYNILKSSVTSTGDNVVAQAAKEVDDALKQFFESVRKISLLTDVNKAEKAIAQAAERLETTLIRIQGSTGVDGVSALGKAMDEAATDPKTISKAYRELAKHHLYLGKLLINTELLATQVSGIVRNTADNVAAAQTLKQTLQDTVETVFKNEPDLVGAMNSQPAVVASTDAITAIRQKIGPGIFKLRQAPGGSIPGLHRAMFVGLPAAFVGLTFMGGEISAEPQQGPINDFCKLYNNFRGTSKIDFLKGISVIVNTKFTAAQGDAQSNSTKFLEDHGNKTIIQYYKNVIDEIDFSGLIVDTKEPDTRVDVAQGNTVIRNMCIEYFKVGLDIKLKGPDKYVPLKSNDIQIKSIKARDMAESIFLPVTRYFVVNDNEGDWDHFVNTKCSAITKEYTIHDLTTLVLEIMNEDTIGEKMKKTVKENSGKGYAKYPYDTMYEEEEQPSEDYVEEWKALGIELIRDESRNTAIEIAKLLVKDLELFEDVLDLAGQNQSVGTEILKKLKQSREKS